MFHRRCIIELPIGVCQLDHNIRATATELIPVMDRRVSNKYLIAWVYLYALSVLLVFGRSLRL